MLGPSGGHSAQRTDRMLEGLEPHRETSGIDSFDGAGYRSARVGARDCRSLMRVWLGLPRGLRRRVYPGRDL